MLLAPPGTGAAARLGSHGLQKQRKHLDMQPCPPVCGCARRDVRRALLEADVSLPVVRRFIKKVEEQAAGLEVSSHSMSHLPLAAT
jgi:hypothetical protein